MKRMRVFITGATGFIGGALAGALVREGAEVHALARATSDRSRLHGVSVNWHEGDVTVPASLKHAMAGADASTCTPGRASRQSVPSSD